MEASKRERIVLFGAVPILAACIGSFATVIAGHYFDSNASSDAILEVVRMKDLTADQRLEILEQVNLSNSRFYNFLNTAAIMLLMPTAGILWAWAARIKG